MTIQPNAWGDREVFKEYPTAAHYSHITPQKTRYHTVPLFEVDSAGGSDYSGNTHTLANYRVLGDMQSEMRQIVTLYGAHGTYGIAFRLDQGPLPQELRDIVDALAAYPILDEDIWSELEDELREENWDDWARDDWRDVLEKAFGEEQIDDLSDDEIDALWQEARVAIPWETQFEEGAVPVFNFSGALDWLRENNPDLETS